MEKLENISFDKQDQELFLIDDLPLKAKAIRNSILPKLGIVVNYAISQIDKVYNTNVHDDCMIAQAHIPDSIKGSMILKKIIVRLWQVFVVEIDLRKRKRLNRITER